MLVHPNIKLLFFVSGRQAVSSLSALQIRNLCRTSRKRYYATNELFSLLATEYETNTDMQMDMGLSAGPGNEVIRISLYETQCTVDGFIHQMSVPSSSRVKLT